MSTNACGASASNDGLGVGALKLPKLDGQEVSPGVWLIGEPTPVPGTDKLRALAEVQGCLCTVELRLRFLTPNVTELSRAAEGRLA